MASPVGAGSVSRAFSVRPDQPGPFLRLDHSAEDALLAVDALAASWERLERRRRRLLLIPAVLLALAAASPWLDAWVGFGHWLYASFAPVLVAGALMGLVATRPPGRTAGRGRLGYVGRANLPLLIAVAFFSGFVGLIASFVPGFSFWKAEMIVAAFYAVPFVLLLVANPSAVRRALRRHRREVRGWWRAPAWRPALLSCREMLEAMQGRRAHVRGRIDLTGVEQRSKLVRETPGVIGRTMRYHDRWCDLVLTTPSGQVTLRGTEDRIVAQGRPQPGPGGGSDWQPHHVRRRRLLHVTQVPERETRSTPPPVAPLRGRKTGELRVLRARERGGRLYVLLAARRRRIDWADLQSVLTRADPAPPRPG